ncbi:uncharacterized protein KY384_000578 [Bacidia gigantensis]|uniref:uncharacterized protein n=1 Tax=Bacidia gigantensis TaxID=2732470 RepID=UPI001D0375A7|nr:uncharacterized protein KY384_000578 [Bacidia gigantensis]KAG8525818.1 hypothetical protein KY384_000578 [Bacidia gigantensis]
MKHHKGFEKSHREARPRDSPDDLPPSREKPNRTGLQDYFIKGEGIHRDVLQRQICFMLGNEARSKPSTYKGVPGFLITAVRPFTENQLEDLIDISREYLDEKRQYEHTQKKHKKPVGELPFEQSETDRRHRHQQEQSREHSDRAPYPPDNYQVSSPPGPFIDSSYTPQPGQGYSHRPGYQPGPPMPNPTYPPSGPPNPRAFPQYDSTGPYADTRAPQRDPYQQPYGNPPGGEYVVDPRDPRNPRYIPPIHEMGRGHAQMYPAATMAPVDEPMFDAYPSHMEIDPNPYQHQARGQAGGAYQPPRRAPTDDDDPYYPKPRYEVVPPRDDKRRRDGRDDDYHRRPGR